MSNVTALQRPVESYYVQLMRALGIPKAHVNRLEVLFRGFMVESKVIPHTDRECIQVIKDFLHFQKARYKPELADSILGQSGCFPYSVRICMLAGRMGIQTYLARSVGMRSTHIFLLDKEGVPINRSELRRGRIVPLTLSQARQYARFVQTALNAVHVSRRFLRRLR